MAWHTGRNTKIGTHREGLRMRQRSIHRYTVADKEPEIEKDSDGEIELGR